MFSTEVRYRQYAHDVIATMLVYPKQALAPYVMLYQHGHHAIVIWIPRDWLLTLHHFQSIKKLVVVSCLLYHRSVGPVVTNRIKLTQDKCQFLIQSYSQAMRISLIVYTLRFDFGCFQTVS